MTKMAAMSIYVKTLQTSSPESFNRFQRNLIPLYCCVKRHVFFAQQYFVNFYFSRSVTLTIFVSEYSEKYQEYIFG